MKRGRVRSWSIFAVCAALLVAGLFWMTRFLHELDTENAWARAKARHQVAINKALWLMDSWLAPQLAKEAARPYFEYQSYYPQQKAYTKILGAIRPGEILTPSPLLTFESKTFVLHFQMAANAPLSSPQVPTGNQADLTEGTFGAEFDLETKRKRLLAFDALLKRLRFDLREAYAGLAQDWNVEGQVKEQRKVQEFVSRSKSMQEARQSALNGIPWNPKLPLSSERVLQGPLLPMWIGADDQAASALIFVRQVLIQKKSIYQGFLVDWEVLRKQLLVLAKDLFGDAQLRLRRSTRKDAAIGEQMLAMVPARFDAIRPKRVQVLRSTTLLVLGVAWLLLLVTLSAVAFSLHRTIQHGERRARFASAVTHELRTPLTTFRMYSEMLAADMVTEPSQRKQYLETLTSEADRLSRLVENVLSYARIEEGRFTSHPVTLRLSELMERIQPILTQRTKESPLLLQASIPRDAEIRVDVDAVTQILFNLVDNACKYARDAKDKAIDLVVECSSDFVTFRVADHGPGIPEREKRRIFRPFDRIEDAHSAESESGVGLGLALARGLAEDLGGSLSLDEERRDGAAFVLTLPRRAVS